MPTTPRLSWTYPSEGQTPFFDALADFFGQQDSSAYAAREDRHIILLGGGTISFTTASGVLSWSDTLQVVAPITGFKWQVLTSTVALDDGQVAYLDLVRAPSSNITLSLQTANQVPNSDSALLVCIRVGDVVYFRNGAAVAEGAPISDLGAPPSGRPQIIIEPGTSRTLDDANHRAAIFFTNAGTITVTVPSAQEAGTYWTLIQDNTGQVQLTGSGVTLNYPATFNPNTSEQNSAITVLIQDTDEAHVSGDLEVA